MERFTKTGGHGASPGQPASAPIGTLSAVDSVNI